jgi:hypothetical protein
MSFSYKTLNSNDITLTSYIANKQWEVTNSTLSQNGITIYIGENLPINKINPFDPINDSETSNEEYRRLIFDSIKNLYYQNYTSGSFTGEFFQSSSFFNYEQSTLTSGSMLTANRNLPTITGSSALGRNGTLFGTSLYDFSSSLYDEAGYDPDKGSKIVVISIDQNIFGSGLSPKSINISASAYNIQDDGEGNLIDTFTSTYIGNVFYSQGLIVLTNQRYLCVFGAPPTSVNDYYSYQNTGYALPQILDILENDFSDCGNIDPSSVEIYGTNFPNYTLNNGIITITPNQVAVIPGNYQLNYTVGNYNSIRSNTSSIDLKITSLPLVISNISSSLYCYGTTGSVPVSFNINYGVPYYSYSLDGGISYTGSNTIFNANITGSLLSGANNTIYVKDYTNTVYSASFNPQYQPVSYKTSILKLPCSSASNDGQIYIEDDGTGTAYQAKIDLGSYTNIPATFTGLSTGSHTIQVKNINSCVTSSLVNLGIYPQLTASTRQSNATCNKATNGSFSVELTNVIDELSVKLLGPTGSYIYDNVLLSSFPNNTITASNLSTGSYVLNVTSSKPYECQSYNNTFTITSPAPITHIVTASYIDSCSNAILFNASGGTPPYIYNASIGTELYTSDSSSITLKGYQPGTFNTFVVDSNGCVSPTTTIETFRRNYVYTGSYCVTSSGQNTGYISSSGVRQVFTSGPYSGSVVTSSYSNGTNLFGPTTNFTQNFISGSNDNIIVCNNSYLRYFEDTASCPISGCFAPIITSVTPLNCATTWNSEYSLTYNSASANATYTVIEFSPYENFDSFGDTATQIINNSAPFTLPLNYFNYTGYNIDSNSFMYFKAYNSCSNGSTSSYSNLFSASCEGVAPPTQWGTVYYEVINNTGISLQLKNGFTANSYPSGNGIQPPNSTRLWQAASALNAYNPDNPNYISSPQLASITITTVGTSPNNLTQQVAGNDLWKVTITGNSSINGNVYTEAESLINSNAYPTAYFSNNYTTGENQFIYIGSLIYDTFTTTGNYREELRVSTNRTYYGPNLIITCSIDYVTP